MKAAMTPVRPPPAEAGGLGPRLAGARCLFHADGYVPSVGEGMVDAVPARTDGDQQQRERGDYRDWRRRSWAGAGVAGAGRRRR